MLATWSGPCPPQLPCWILRTRAVLKFAICQSNNVDDGFLIRVDLPYRRQHARDGFFGAPDLDFALNLVRDCSACSLEWM